MASSVLRDLQLMKTMLDSPLRATSKYGSPVHTSQAYCSPPPRQQGYTFALHSAEKSVDRLGHAIEEAEAEMEAALRRTTDVHKSQLRQKELEATELQRVVAAKERSIDSLRDTLATTKRTYEGRLVQAEAALAHKGAEVQSLQEQLRTARLERDNFEVHLHREAAAAMAAADQLRASEAAMREMGAQSSAGLRQREAEVAQAQSTVKQERHEKDQLQDEVQELRRRVETLSMEVQRAHAEAVACQERSELEVDDLRRKLRTEKNLRRACETWLRSELKSREEMDALLGAIKDSASAGAEASSGASRRQQQHQQQHHQHQLEELLLTQHQGEAALRNSHSTADSFSNSRRFEGQRPFSSAAASGQALKLEQVQRHERQAQEVQELLQTMRHTSPVKAKQALSAAAEASSLSRQLDGDNQLLKAELAAARKLLADRLRL